MAWRQPDNKQLFEQMMGNLLTHTYASRGLNKLFGLLKSTYP